MITIKIPGETSSIRILDALYEVAWTRLDEIQKHQPEDGDGATTDQRARASRLDRAVRQCLAEAEAVRVVLFHQMPLDDADLTILCCHINDQSRADQSLETEEMRSARLIGTEAAFDYLVSEGRVALDAMGKAFHDSAMAAFNRVRTRFAVTETLEMEG